jgi:peptide-methionine (S)-S-oxide reductase
MSSNARSGLETATLAGGCFWCLEAVYLGLRGVERVTSGYMGGHTARPTYQDVCNGDTGHAEVVRIEFDPAQLSFRELLEVFFTIHDPTTLDRQGNDVGSQYRSAIYFHSPEQERIAKEVIGDLTARRVWRDPIVTEVTAESTFHAAEAYHHDYFARNSYQPYCQVVVAPKVAKFMKVFGDRAKLRA